MAQLHEASPRESAPGTPAVIRYPRFTALHHEIARCQALSRSAGEPHCMALEGVTGAGKSTLVQAFAAAFPQQETEAGTDVPIFYLEMPAPATVKGVAAAMLERLGDPLAHHGTLWSMNSRLIKLLIACHVTLVILDDFHHLIDTDTNRVLVAVSEWLKVLIKETGVPFLVVGIEGQVERVLRANPQLSRLFAIRETLQPLPPDATFARFVGYAEQVVGLPLVAAWSRPEFLTRLHYATDGVVANLMNLLRTAALLSQEHQGSVIDEVALAQAFQQRLAKHLYGKINPFDGRTAEPFAVPMAAPHDHEPAVGRRSRRRSGAAPTVEGAACG
ncbi:MAG TPA: TniB family NTP-binding protein [Herpetosiphonaceae bacterium]|nr:TniB family NTP-binding protein [Herpetosiphonaceae bacterium]